MTSTQANQLQTIYNKISGIKVNKIDFMWGAENSTSAATNITLSNSRKFSSYTYIYLTFGEIGGDYNHISSTPTLVSITDFKKGNTHTIDVGGGYYINLKYINDTTFNVSYNCTAYRHSYLYGIW